MTDDETNIDLMTAQLRELSARMARKIPLEIHRALLGEVADERGEDFPPELPPRKTGGCGGAWE